MNTRLVLLFAAIAGVFLIAPSTASAQFPAESWDEDRCDNQSGANSDGPYSIEPQYNHIYVTLNGSGRVSGAMYRTRAQGPECLNPRECPPACAPQGWAVSSVCEVHCWHNHNPPYRWWVSLDPNGVGASFVGWSASCVPTKEVPRDVCIVHMETDRHVTAHFSPTPDTQAPSRPTASAQPYGRFSVDLSWTAASDQWLAGYDIYQGSSATPIARVGPGDTRFRVENLLCRTDYSFSVEAYDWSGNAARSAPVSVTTGPCIGEEPTGQRPNTVLHVKPPRSTRARSAFFHFGVTASSPPATRYQCKLDRGRWRACSGQRGIRYRSLRRGYHTFQVRAGNANGFDGTPARWRWRVR